jgi:arginase
VPDEPGGLTWEGLTELLRAALGAGGCVGASFVIYDPDQDPERRDARRIVRLLDDVL